jgi:hypothetical protein
MVTRLVAIEMYAKDAALGESITAAIAGIGKVSLRLGGDPVAVPEEAAEKFIRDHKRAIRRAKGDVADVVIENAKAAWRATFLATYGFSADEACAKSQAELAVAQAKADEAKRIRDEVRELRSAGPVTNAVSQPMGRKG